MPAVHNGASLWSYVDVREELQVHVRPTYCSSRVENLNRDHDHVSFSEDGV